MAHIAIDARIINSTTGTYVERLLHYLQTIADDHTYSVLVPEKDVDFWKPSDPRFTVHPVPYTNYSFNEQVGFKQYLDKLSPDLVHFCMPQQPLLYRGKTVTTIHDLTLLDTYNSDKNWLVFHAKQFVGRFVFKRVAKQSNHIITPTKYTKQAVISRLGAAPDTVSVTYEAADVSAGTLEPYKHPYKEFILYVGQQSDYKNIRRLGDAHQLLQKDHPNLGLILVGKINDSAKKNKQYFTDKNYRNITFTGFVPDAQRDWLYTQTQAYIFPSLMEGFGLPGLEAMAYGAPVVSSNATCLPEVYADAAQYFNPTDVPDIARAIDDVLKDPTLRAELITKGHARHSVFSWQKMAHETHAIYESVLMN